MTTHSTRDLERQDVERGRVTIAPTTTTNGATVLMVVHLSVWTDSRENEETRMCAMRSRTEVLQESALRRPLLTIGGAARYTGLTERFVRRLRQEHMIRFYKVDGLWGFKSPLAHHTATHAAPELLTFGRGPVHLHVGILPRRCDARGGCVGRAGVADAAAAPRRAPHAFPRERSRGNVPATTGWADEVAERGPPTAPGMAPGQRPFVARRRGVELRTPRRTGVSGQYRIRVGQQGSIPARILAEE